MQREVEDLTKRCEATAQRLAATHNRLWNLHNLNKQLQGRIRACEASQEAFALVSAATGAAVKVEAPPKDSQASTQRAVQPKSSSSFSNSVPVGHTAVPEATRAAVPGDEASLSSGSLHASDPSDELMDTSFGPRCVLRALL